MLKMNRKEFQSACQRQGVDVTDKQLDQLEKYLHLLQEWNQKMNLTAIDEEDQIWEKHFYDCVIPFVHETGETICDVGSGAGFPGIPVAIVYPQFHVTLVEPLQKRCRFLETVKQELGLDIQICNERAEDFAKKNRAQFDIVTSRAVARLTILLELCIPLLRVTGSFIALKGKNAENEVEKANVAMETLHVILKDEKTVRVADANHVNLYFEKMKPTSKKYPRVYGQIKKKPLGE